MKATERRGNADGRFSAKSGQPAFDRRPTNRHTCYWIVDPINGIWLYVIALKSARLALYNGGAMSNSHNSEETIVQSDLGSAISYITDILRHFDEPWFRGNHDYEFGLVPSVFRDTFKYNESKMIEEFKRRYADHARTHICQIDWLTLMQHYGLPTRLLDWSSNLLVGLYFACQNPLDLKDSTDGALFILDAAALKNDPQTMALIEMQTRYDTRLDFVEALIQYLDNSSKINEIFVDDLKKDKTMRFALVNKGISSLTVEDQPIDLIRPPGADPTTFDHEISNSLSGVIPINPPYLNPRLKSQSGYFTLHGGLFADNKEYVSFKKLENCNSKAKIHKIRVSSDVKTSLREQLKYVGIREATLFPEMEYQSRDIKERFKD